MMLQQSAKAAILLIFFLRLLQKLIAEGSCRFEQYTNSNIYGGVENPASTESECMEACRMNSSCQGIDWTPANRAGQRCHISSKLTNRNSNMQGITHYDFICNESDSRQCYEVRNKTICYFPPANGSKMNWDEAYKFCRDRNATLPAILDSDHKQALEKYLLQLPRENSIWIYTAGRKSWSHDPNYPWRWVNGKQVRTRFGETTLHDRYLWGCISLNTDMIHNGVMSCSSHPKRSVCQFQESICKTMENATFLLHDRSHCFVISKEELSWYEARQKCIEGGGDLAIFEDVDNFAAFSNITSAIEENTTEFFIGARRNWWTWRVSEPIDVIYTRMKRQDYYSYLPEEHSVLDCLCIDSRNDFRWVNCNCSEPRFVHCQSGSCRFEQYNNSNIYGGVEDPASTESECMEACRMNSSCQGIDWTPANKAGQRCHISSKMTDRNSNMQGITHYDFICNEIPSTSRTKSPPLPQEDKFSNVRRCYEGAGGSRVCYFTPENATRLKFSSAVQWCKDHNATLPIIKNNVDQKILENFLETIALPIYLLWTAGNKVKTGVWSWTNGPPFRGTDNGDLPKFASFDIDQRSPETLEQKGRLFRSFGYDERLDNNISTGYICQFPGLSCPSNGNRTKSNECQVVNEEQVSWYEARNRCILGGGDLATFEDVSNIDKLASLLTLDKSYHIGLENSRWVWYQTVTDKFTDTARYTNFNKLFTENLELEDGHTCSLSREQRFRERPLELENYFFCLCLETFTYKWTPCNCDLTFRFICQRVETNDLSETTVHTHTEQMNPKTPHHKFCDKDNDTEYSITWARTVSGKTDYQPCTRTTNGSCSRNCIENKDGTAKWANANCNGCFDTEFVDLLAKVTNVEKSVLKNETTKIAKQLSSVTNKSEGLTSGNLNASVMLINRLAVLQQNSTLIPNANEIKSIVQATSNVLRENNTKGWEELEVVNNTLASAILFSIDVYGRSLSALNKSSHTREEAENLVLEAWSLPKLDRPANIEFPNRSSWDANSGDGILFSIGALEKSISSESWKDLRMWGSYYRTVAEYLPGNKKATSEVVGEIVLQSRVISFTVDGLKTDGKLESPVTITLKHNQEKNSSYKRICSFWNFTRSEWDSEGCLLVSTNSTHTVCRCDHLTNFAILMSLNPHHDDTVLSRISVIGLSISVAALILTILVYALTWKHSKSAQATVLLNLCVALTIAYIIFLTGADKIESSFKENDSSPKSPPTGGCTAVAILLHYFFLAAFFIMLIEGVELLLYIIFVFHVRQTRETIMLIASAWFLPLIIVGVSLGVTKLDGYGHDKACWLSTKKGLIWAFIAPVLTIIVANFVILIIVLRWMTKQKSKLAKNAKKRDDIRATIWNLSVTCPVLGLGWFFGFLSVSFESVVFQYLFVIANSLQGVLIFIFHALFHNKKMNEKISSVYSNYICRCRKADLSISTQSTSSQDQTGKKPPKKSSARKSAKPNQGKYDVSQSAGTELTSFNESEAPEPVQTVESTQESQQTVESTQESQQTVESTDKRTSTPHDEQPSQGTDRKYSLQSTGAETTSFEDSESARLITSPKLQPPSKTGEEPFVPKAVKYYEDIAKKDQPVGAGTTLSAIIDSEALVSTL